jgi:hypothetical protein
VGAYALHLQCPWRLSSTSGVVAGSSDRFVEGDPDWADDFEAGRAGTALVDVHLARWIEANRRAPLTVQTITVDRCGGFVLALTNDWAIEVFPDASDASHDMRREQWRLLEPGTERPHFVLLNSGVEAP